MTQEELAGKAGLSSRTIQAIERGQVHRPHRESVRLLANALDLQGPARAEFEVAARPGQRHPPGSHCGYATHECPTPTELASCLAHRMSSCGERHVDLHGLGHSANPAAVLARVFLALGVDPRDFSDCAEPAMG